MASCACEITVSWHGSDVIRAHERGSDCFEGEWQMRNYVDRWQALHALCLAVVCYYDDNYASLLPGETRRIEVLCPAGSGRCARVALRGWNAEPRDVAVGPAEP
jgi:hypothetical protein